MKEIWLKYRDTNYYISNTGKAKNKEKILVSSTKGDVFKRFGPYRLHRAVAELFVSNLENKQ
jgi:hypothetical protein